MIVDSERIFGGKGKFFTFKSKVLKRRRGGDNSGFPNSPLKIIAIVITVCALLLGGSYLLNNRLVRERFMIRNIIIEGNQLVPDEIIVAASGAKQGADLMRFDIYNGKYRVEKISQILSASVRRRLPDTIIIQVEERSARAIVKLEGKGLSLCVDSEGMLLPYEASGGLDDMTVIYGAEISEPDAGKRSNDKNLMTALFILKLHDNSELKNKVNAEAVIIEKNGEVRLHEREKAPSRRLYKVYLGTNDFEQRLANLIEILKVELVRNDRLDRKIDLTFECPVSAPVGAEEGS